MPQIWLTYEELAALLNCDAPRARAAAAAIPLDRRKSRDGQTRAKLTPPLINAFLDVALRQRFERDVAICANDLRTMHERMIVCSGSRPKLPSVIAS